MGYTTFITDRRIILLQYFINANNKELSPGSLLSNKTSEPYPQRFAEVETRLISTIT